MTSFNRFKLLLRNLRYFRAANLAVIAGMTVATAVLTGSLMVGDSVRLSLRELAEKRLDFVDHALVSPRFIDQSLARRLGALPDFNARFVSITPGITLRGSAAGGAGSTKAPGVQITALADHFAVPPNTAVINSTLAQSLSGPHDAMRFSLPSPDDAPRDSALAKRSRNDTIASFAVNTTTLAPEGTFQSLFNLAGGQRTPRNAWVNLKNLQDELDRADQANLFFVAAKPGHATPADAEALNHQLRQVATLSDYGLDQQKSPDKSAATFNSKSTYLHPAIIQAADEIAKEQSIPLTKASTYLVNHVVATSGEKRTLHYALAAGINAINNQELAPDEIAVNQWTADQMHLKPGDTLRLDYYLRAPNGDLAEVQSDRPTVALIFKLVKILPMTGLGADPSLTPTYKGLTDADTIADWRPPAGLTINKKLVTKEDEQYWGKYRGAPKIFINLKTATRLWGTAFGDVTSIQIPAASADAFSAALVKKIDPAALGLSFRPLRAQQLEASAGSTDFSELFISFSFFLLLAAVVLVAMLFRLSVESRARQLGLLAACGFSPKQLRRLALKEGFLLALIGGILGLAAAIGWTAFIVHGLRTWWLGAVGTTALQLHIVPVTLVYGLVGGVIVALLAILWAVRRVGKTAAASLLAGAMASDSTHIAKPAIKSFVVAVLAIITAVALFSLGFMRKLEGNAAFLGGGSLLLLAGLLLAFAKLRPVPHVTQSLGLVSLAIRNATRNRTRSLLCISLIALASFTLVTVSSMQSTAPDDTFQKSSGAGGFALIAQTDIPLLGDLNTLDGRKLLMKQSSAASPLWADAKFAMMRSWAGQDISCLNITRPDSPTILAVPPIVREPGRFQFASQITPAANPWDLLDQPQADPNIIPVIADDESAKYILKLSLGDSLPVTDAAGRPRKLRLVATLSGSIFQSEMLMSETHFLQLFPAQSGYTTILAQTTPDHADTLRNLLNQTLNDPADEEKSDYSATIDTTASRLAAFHEVANTYLATFQVLGSLGLMLGTIGLAVVLIRNLIERRAELALLGALGFTRPSRSRLVLTENAALLFIGLVIGAGSALAGVIPNTIGSTRHINIPALSIALAAVVFIGLLSLVLATRLAGNKTTSAALRVD